MSKTKQTGIIHISTEIIDGVLKPKGGTEMSKRIHRNVRYWNFTIFYISISITFFYMYPQI